MRKAISIYGDKEYITEVSRAYVFFHFPDGSQDRLVPHKKDLEELYSWITSEMAFYNRMYQELHNQYEKTYEKFKATRHYYTEEEISKACKKDRFSYITMEIKNERYKEDIHEIFGISKESHRVNDKYWKLYRLARQIKTAFESLK